jgi:hypothetical protein
MHYSPDGGADAQATSPDGTDPYEDAQSYEFLRGARRASQVRELLAGPHAVAVYRQLARISTGLTDREYRRLDGLLSFADPDLSNAFPSRRQWRNRTGGPSQSLDVLDHVIRSLERKGWIRRIPFAKDDGSPSSNGYQFRIPPNELAEGDEGWDGPINFRKRLHVTRKAT